MLGRLAAGLLGRLLLTRRLVSEGQLILHARVLEVGLLQLRDRLRVVLLGEGDQSQELMALPLLERYLVLGPLLRIFLRLGLGRVEVASCQRRPPVIEPRSRSSSRVSAASRRSARRRTQHPVKQLLTIMRGVLN